MLTTSEGRLAAMKAAKKIKSSPLTFESFLLSNFEKTEGEEASLHLENSSVLPTLSESKFQVSDSTCLSKTLVSHDTDSLPDISPGLETPSAKMCSKKDAVSRKEISESQWKKLFFQTYGDYEQWLQDYCSRTFTVTAIRDGVKNKSKSRDVENYPYQRLSRVCSHGQRLRGRGKSIRPNQSYMATQCPFKINIVLHKNGYYTITKFIQNHEGHETSQSAFSIHPQNRVIKDESKVRSYSNMIRKKVPTHALKQLIKEDLGKQVTAQDLINMERKDAKYRKHNDVQESIELLKEKKQGSPGSNLQLVVQKDEKFEVIKVIFWQSTKQREYFEMFGTMLFIDGTYNLTDRGYILMPFLVIDNHGKSKLVAWALLNNESQDTLKQAFSAFKTANEEAVKKLEYVMIDKDFCEINALFQDFPHVHFVICSWHASKAVDRYVNNMRVELKNQHLKEKLRNFFHELLYAPSVELYQAAWNKITLLSTEGAVFDQAVNYLETYWHHHRENFARCFLKKKEILHSFTNNRSEAFNKVAKDIITRQFKIQDVIRSLFELEDEQHFSKRKRDWESTNKTFCPSNIHVTDTMADEILKISRMLVTTEIVKKILSQYFLLDKVDEFEVDLEKNQLSCPRLSGPCTISSTESLPCKHLFFVRSFNKEVMLDSAMIGKRWFKTCDENKSDKKICKTTTCKEKKIINVATKLKRFQKFTQTEVKTKLQAHFSNCQDFEMEDKIKQLDYLLDMWENGVYTTVADGSIVSVPFEKTKSKETTVKFDTCHINKKLKTTGLTSGKPTSTKETQFDKESLESWQIQVNSYFRKHLSPYIPWEKHHFDILEKTDIIGGQAWLSDAHMLLLTGQLQKQHPNVSALFPTTLYMSTGFPKIDFCKDFIQPIHAGSDHWAVLTNIFVDPKERHNTVILFDSLVVMEKNSRTKCNINPAVFWQAAQLLQKDFRQAQANEWGLIVKVYPCMQQSNAWDCGIFCIANVLALVAGRNPAYIRYTGNLRQQFLEMVKCHNLYEMECVPTTKHSIHAHLQRIEKLVSMCEMEKMTTIMCHCQMPKSWNNLITCSICNKDFHQRCYLIGSQLIANKIEFTCYGCQASSAKVFSVNQTTKDFIGKLATLGAYKLGKFLPIVLDRKSRVTNLPTTEKEFSFLQMTIQTYSLCSLVVQSGTMYEACYNYFTSSVSETAFNNISFADINVAQKIFLFLLILNDVERLHCNDIWDDSTKDVIDLTKTKDINICSLEEKLSLLKSTFKTLQNDVSLFCDKNRNKAYSKCIDYYSEFKYKFEMFERGLEEVQLLYQRFSSCAKGKTGKMEHFTVDIKKLSSQVISLREKLDGVQTGQSIF